MNKTEFGKTVVIAAARPSKQSKKASGAYARKSDRAARLRARVNVTVRHYVLPGQEVARADAQERETIAAFLDRSAWNITRLPTICVINGAPVLRRFWKRRRIKDADQVAFVSRPWGGSSPTGKQIGGLVALVALAAIAGPFGQAVAGTLFAAETAAFAITSAAVSTGLVLGGSLLIGSLSGRPLH